MMIQTSVIQIDCADYSFDIIGYKYLGMHKSRIRFYPPPQQAFFRKNNISHVCSLLVQKLQICISVGF